MTGNADNIVLKKDAAEEKLDFINVEYIKINSRQGQEFEIQVVDSAMKTGPYGTLIWSGRPLPWVMREKYQELRLVSENGKWVAYDSKGNKVDSE